MSEKKERTHLYQCRHDHLIPSSYFTSGSISNCPSSLRSEVIKEGGQLAYYNQHCYERVPQLRTWYAAETDCQRKGGYLVQISDAQEQAFIQQFLSQVHLQHQVWIGLHDSGHEEIFTWISGDYHANKCTVDQRTVDQIGSCSHCT